MYDPDSHIHTLNRRYSWRARTYLNRTAPAGGAAAAAPDGGALIGPSPSPHLPVVGARNPVAVPGVAR
jgi:hypothetical protein